MSTENPPPVLASTEALRALLDGYLRCPTEPALRELEAALRVYQTEWIGRHAGQPTAVAASAPPPPPTPVPKPRFKLDSDQRAVLERLAAGWEATTADLPRWAWFEDRELIRLDPDPSGQGPERLRLAAEGWHAIGRLPPAAAPS